MRSRTGRFIYFGVGAVLSIGLAAYFGQPMFAASVFLVISIMPYLRYWLSNRQPPI